MILGLQKCLYFTVNGKKTDKSLSSAHDFSLGLTVLTLINGISRLEFQSLFKIFLS